MDKSHISRVLLYIRSRAEAPTLADAGLTVTQARELMRLGYLLAHCDNGTWHLRVSEAGADLVSARLAA